jgi:tetratricopeptide (TPR) repeat protein
VSFEIIAPYLYGLRVDHARSHEQSLGYVTRQTGPVKAGLRGAALCLATALVTARVEQSRPVGEPLDTIWRPEKAVPRLVHPPAPRPAAPRRERRERSTPPPPPDEGVALRLAIGRTGVGLELARPVKLGPLVVTELAAKLPGVRFPVDVSGGVPRFRHRRGELQRLEVELGGRALERFAAPRLRGVVGTRTPDVWIGVGRTAATVCVSCAPDPGGETQGAAPVLAFEVHALVEGGDLLLVVSQARGSALPAPATAMAIGCVEALLGGLGSRRGSTFVLPRGPAALARAMLPEAGARVPAAEDMSWTSIGAQGDTWLLQAVQGAIGAAPEEPAVLAREAASLAVEGDEAMLGGDLAAARAACLEALERAPRHFELLRRVAEVDATAGGRAEAALAMLVEARLHEGARLGTLPGELLAETGDTEAAIASLERTGDADPAPALAARAFEIAARLVRDPQEAARWLDRAIAKSPRATGPRWARIARRLELGSLDDAMADVEHLEAMAGGVRARHAVWVRAGRLWQAAGLGSRAASLFERALRYLPDDPRAMGGLGSALVHEGRAARGIAVLGQALEAAEARREPTSSLRLELGVSLAEALDDLPTAIAHVSAIAPEAPEAPMARGLEGRWRARLGDLAGASLSFARLRELASTLPSTTPAPPAEPIASLLVEAAEMHRVRLRDPLSAQRYLAAAIRLCPRDARILRLYREIGALVVSGQAGIDDRQELEAPEVSEDFAPIEAGSATHRTVTERPPLDLSMAPEAEEDAEAASRVEELTRRLQGHPGDDAVADELAGLLRSLGRGHELLALLLARLEDATPERRAELAPRAREALEDMAARAEQAGRHEEAALYRGVVESLSAAPPKTRA